MQVAGNSVQDFFEFLSEILKNQYSNSEIEEIAFRLFQHFFRTPSRTDINFRKRLNESELLLIYDAAKRIAEGEPLQYVLGEVYFYKGIFKVNKHVLIPRPETEELVDLVVKKCIPEPLAVLDIGTGSGCIAVSLKMEWNNKTTVFACDVSEDALLMAEKNARQNKADVNFFKLDILNPGNTSAKYDVIVSNPPYILDSEKSSLNKSVVDFEPHKALFVSGNDSILFYRCIIDFSVISLNSRGWLFFELNPFTADEVYRYAKEKNIFSEQELLYDMSGNLRFFIGKRA